MSYDYAASMATSLVAIVFEMFAGKRASDGSGPASVSGAILRTDPGPEFSAGRPAVLFEGMYFYNIVPSRTYDVASDGRFLLVGPPDPGTSPRQVNVILHGLTSPP